MALAMDKYNLSRDANLRCRLIPVIVEKANFFINQGTETGLRMALAKAIGAGAVNSYLEAFAIQAAVDATLVAAAIPSNGTVNSSLITDTQLDSYVGFVWSKIAGV